MSVELAFLGNLGPMEMFLILLIVVIFFGAKKIPELAKGLGQGIKEFKKASSDIKQEIEDSTKEIEKK